MEGKLQSVSPIHASSRLVLLKAEDALESPGGFVKHTGGWASPQSFWFRRSGPEPRICISKQFPSEADADSTGPHFENPSVSGFHHSFTFSWQFRKAT